VSCAPSRWMAADWTRRPRASSTPVASASRSSAPGASTVSSVAPVPSASAPLSNWMLTSVVDPGAEAWSEVAEPAAAAALEEARAAVRSACWCRRKEERHDFKGATVASTLALATTLAPATPRLLLLLLLELPTHACAHADTCDWRSGAL
jgi:hypothetical protein